MVELEVNLFVRFRIGLTSLPPVTLSLIILQVKITFTKSIRLESISQLLLHCMIPLPTFWYLKVGVYLQLVVLPRLCLSGFCSSSTPLIILIIWNESPFHLIFILTITRRGCVGGTWVDKADNSGSQATLILRFYITCHILLPHWFLLWILSLRYCHRFYSINNN